MREAFLYCAVLSAFMLFALPPVLLWRLAAARLRKKRRTTMRHEVGLSAFALFLFGLAMLTVVPIVAITASGPIFRPLSLDLRRVNLIPFHVFTQTFTNGFHIRSMPYFLVNFLGNILMFLPVGFCPPLLWRRRTMWKTLLTGFGISLFIELFQLFQDRGTDVDDLWLNTLGVLLGYLTFLLARRLRRSGLEKWKMRES